MAGFITQALWTPLARFTFTLVQGMLAGIYPTIVSKPDQLIIGTPAFKVAISPECSGYEGIGLIVAFLSVYLWLFRKELRFPGALLLLPVGAAAIWILNAVRIVALIVIGHSGWPDIALGGFHSQAGWLAFNGLALGIVAMTVRGRYFAIEPDSRVQIHTSESDDQTSAYLAPFMAILAAAMLTGALSAGFEWLYPVRVLAACGVLWIFRKSYRGLTWTFSGSAVVIGSVAFAIWLALSPATGDKQGWPAALASMPPYWAAAWLFIRVAGYVVTVPVAEELAFRGFLTRRIIRAQFDTVPVGFFTWSSFLISSIVFGALHGTFWAAGTVAGMLFASALYRRRSLGDAVLAHATTNGLIALYVLATGSWSVWS
jgi:exosortase E/protease (VPEID-CTERM system)